MEFQLTALRIGEGPISVLPMPGGRVLWLVERDDDADIRCWVEEMREIGHEVIIGTLDDLTTRALALLLEGHDDA